ncbi:MAG: GNAT family N-acetyltransferase [Pseudomonadota bacterium]
MTVTIRLAEKTDVPAVDALLALSYPRLLKADYAPSVLVTILPAISRGRPSLVAGGTYFLAETPDGTLVAAGGWTPGAPGPVLRDGPRTGHVRHVVGHPDYLRRGYARHVLDTAMTQARDAGMRRLECLSTRTAVPFYTAMGFDIRQPVDVPIGPARIPFPSILMERAL